VGEDGRGSPSIVVTQDGYTSPRIPPSEGTVRPASRGGDGRDEQTGREGTPRKSRSRPQSTASVHEDAEDGWILFPREEQLPDQEAVRHYLLSLTISAVGNFVRDKRFLARLARCNDLAPVLVDLLAKTTARPVVSLEPADGAEKVLEGGSSLKNHFRIVIEKTPEQKLQLLAQEYASHYGIKADEIDGPDRDRLAWLMQQSTELATGGKKSSPERSIVPGGSVYVKGGGRSGADVRDGGVGNGEEASWTRKMDDHVALLDTLRSISYEQHVLQCLGACRSIVLDPSCCSRVVQQPNVLKILVVLLRSENTSVVEKTLQLILQLLDEDMFLFQVVQCGVTEPLLRLSMNHMAILFQAQMFHIFLKSIHADVTLSALTALTSLSRIPFYADSVAQVGVVPLILAKMQSSTSDIVWGCARVTEKLSCCSARARKELNKHEAVRTLLEVLRGGDTRPWVSAGQALGHLCSQQNEESCTVRDFQRNVLPALVASFFSTDVEAALVALTCLAELCVDENIRRAFIEHETAANDLVDCLLSSSNIRVQRKVAILLGLFENENKDLRMSMSEDFLQLIGGVPESPGMARRQQVLRQHRPSNSSP